jgi:hypothetical protein
MRKHTKLNWLILAGLAGGLAEVIWIGLYSSVSDITLPAMGKAIAATVFSGGSELLLSPVSGLIVHMLLSVLLALGFGYILLPLIEKRFHHRQIPFITSVVMLIAVWKINFFLLLPVWNPGFIGLLPLGITLVSKVLFGLTMGLILSQYRQKFA